MGVGRDSGGCFFDGLMDLMEFAAKYERLGRLGFDDWQIVSEVASAVSKMLREGRVRGCPNTEDIIVNIVVRTLDDLGIDRYSIMRGYLQGTTEDVKRILRRIFPNVEQIIRPPPHVVRAQPRVVSRGSEIPTYVVPSNYGYGGGKGRPRRRRRGRAIAGFIIGLVLLLIVIGAAWSLRHPPQTQQTSATTSSVSTQPNSAVTYTQSTIDPTWVSQFIGIVNQYRQSSGAPPLQYCQWLSNFAYVRFETMIQNPAISHYGFDQDFSEYLSQYQSFLITGEEALYPSGYTPSEYVQNLQSQAPLHWEELMNGNYTYYGYYIGHWLAYVIVGSCPVTEIPGPNIDIPQYFQSYGCSVELENTTWLVIELSNWCSGPVTIPVSVINEGLSPQYYVYLPIQYNLPTSDEYVELGVDLSSTSPVRLFVFTPDQFNYFKGLYEQEVWSFTGPAYYYGGESTTFNTVIMLSTSQLASGGYYLVISNVLPSAQYAYIVGNVTITYTPATPNIPAPGTLVVTGSQTQSPYIQLPNITIPPPPKINITIPTINITINTQQNT
jgi:hypothetical protein